MANMSWVRVKPDKGVVGMKWVRVRPDKRVANKPSAKGERGTAKDVDDVTRSVRVEEGDDRGRGGSENRRAGGLPDTNEE